MESQSLAVLKVSSTRGGCSKTVCGLDPATGVWAVIHVDFVNAFPRFEWGAVDAAMAAQLPEFAAWTRWCHDDVADVDLPSGDVHRARRGAEQGDPHGSLQCGVVLANVVHSTSEEMARRKDLRSPGCFSFWYCDDGQAICRPPDVDLFLECLDAEAEKVGATRGDGPDVKKSCAIGRPSGRFYPRSSTRVGSLSASAELAKWARPTPIATFWAPLRVRRLLRTFSFVNESPNSVICILL